MNIEHVPYPSAAGREILLRAGCRRLEHEFGLPEGACEHLRGQSLGELFEQMDAAHAIGETLRGLGL